MSLSFSHPKPSMTHASDCPINGVDFFVGHLHFIFYTQVLISSPNPKLIKGSVKKHALLLLQQLLSRLAGFLSQKLVYNSNCSLLLDFGNLVLASVLIDEFILFNLLRLVDLLSTLFLVSLTFLILWSYALKAVMTSLVFWNFLSSS